ncbi:MAG: macro domain-containing protein [Thermodesulfovibrionales bacterium]
MDEKLKSAVWESLRLASQRGFTSISIPAISSGIYGFPKDRCAEILVSQSVNFLMENNSTSLRTIEFCIYDEDTLRHFASVFSRL